MADGTVGCPSSASLGCSTTICDNRTACYARSSGTRDLSEQRRQPPGPLQVAGDGVPPASTSWTTSFTAAARSEQTFGVTGESRGKWARRRMVARRRYGLPRHRRGDGAWERHGRSRSGSRLRRRNLNPSEVVMRRGLRVTAVALTVVEAAARRGGGPTVMDSALQRHARATRLWSAHLRNKGRYGSPRARRLLQAASDGAHSEAERLLIRLLNDSGNYRVVGLTTQWADIGSTSRFPTQVAIEVDGFAFHSDQYCSTTTESDRTPSR